MTITRSALAQRQVAAAKIPHDRRAGRHRGIRSTLRRRHAIASARAHRILARRASLSLALVLAVAIPAAALWSTPPAAPSAAMAGLSLARDRGPTGPAEITGIDTGLLWSTPGQARADVTVENKSSATVTAKVWWIVGRIGDPHPWTDPVLVSPAPTIAISPNVRLHVPIVATGLPADGTYALSAWVHTSSGDTFVPSDGVALAAGLTVRAADTALHHVGAADPTLRITAARGTANGSKLSVDITITNTALRARSVRITAFQGRERATADLVIDAASAQPATLTLNQAQGATLGVMLSLAELDPDGVAHTSDRVSLAG